MRRTQSVSAGMICLALASAAGAQQAIAPVSVTEPVLTEKATRAPRAFPVVDNGLAEHASLFEAAAHSAAVFDAVLVNSMATTPPGMKVLVTEYTFQVYETLKGEVPTTITIRESGGVSPDGSGVATVESHKLTLGGRYLVFLEPGHEQALFPFTRILQIMDSGATMADETGRFIIGLENGIPVVRAHRQGLSMSYLGAAPELGETRQVGPPDVSSTPIPEQPVESLAIDQGPIAAELVLALLRTPGAQIPAGTQPAGLNSALIGNTDYNYCGYVNNSVNFASWFPDDGPWSWFNTAELDWDNLVDYSGAGPWIYGLATSGGNPIRNEAPDANNSRNNAGTPSDAQMTAGGYGTWAANGSPNGITFFWFTGGSCTRIREVDAFVNPSNISDEVQFRKSMVHELGHGIGFGHEDRYVSIMVSGTWRVPPNYNSNYYNRADECLGGRVMLNAANGLGASWILRNWRDIATVSQAHPSYGSSGDVGPNVTDLSDYNVSTGDPVQIRHMFVENRGNTDYSGTVTIKVYLSTNTTISSGDYEVYSGSWGSFGNEAVWNNGTLNLDIGPEIPTGNYYIGWILTAGETQLTSGNDTGIMVRDYYGGYAERTIHVNNLVPVNDDCAGSIAIANGTTPFTTEWASTDGPEEPFCSFCCGDLQVHNDIWYRYTATCTGTATVDTCGSSFDTKIAVYTGVCPVANGTAIACNDDSCGLQSRVTFPVIAGHAYRIRVGGYNGASGTGDITISCNTCYANCDASTIAPILNVQDFACFLNKFAANDPWANCDGSTIAPVLNVQDFACFLNRFAAGCS